MGRKPGFGLGECEYATGQLFYTSHAREVDMFSHFGHLSSRPRNLSVFSGASIQVCM